MARGGWFKAWRQLFEPDHHLALNEPVCPRFAWLDLCGMAQHQPHDHPVGYDLVELERGQFLASLRYLERRWRWSRSKVSRFLKMLETRSQIETLRETPSGTVYLIVAYDDYQGEEDTPRDTPRDGPRDSGVTAARQQRDKEKKEEEGREKERRRDVGGGSAPAEPTDEAPAQQPQQQHLEAMEKLVDTAADQVPEGVERTRLIGELSMIVSGDDVTAWHDATGTRVPWEDRPRLLRLALKRWWLDREEYPNPRSALRYVIGQQYNPYELPEGGRPAMTNEEEQKHYRDHRLNGQQRPNGTKPKEPEGGNEAQLWAAKNPDRFQEISDEVIRTHELDTDDPLQRAQAFGLALKRVREEVLA